MTFGSELADYYTRTASLYDAMHVATDDEHYRALKRISVFHERLGFASFLDVGCGTGRGLKYFLDQHPEVRSRGVEPVQALIHEAINKNGVPPDLIAQADGAALSFADESFDAVSAFGVLHHVREPRKIVAELMRVARRAIFISDCNRFGQGSMPARLAKLVLYRAGLWGIANRAKTRGKGYRWSQGDGISYSYSVYDSVRQLAAWGGAIELFPTNGISDDSWAQPRLSASHILLCAVRGAKT